MSLNYNSINFYTFGSLLLFLVIMSIILSRFIPKKSSIKSLVEGLTDFERYSHKIIPYPKDALINYNDINSPLYSHTVNLPINDPVSCNNFCGPKSQCSITREQCTSDIDCSGCNPGPVPQNACITKDVKPYDATGKLGQNQGLQYSPLTTGFNNHNADFAELYPGSKDAQIVKPYLGVDLWTDSFNEGLKLYNKKRTSYDKYNEGISNTISDIIPTSFKLPPSKISYYEPKYPMRISATGQFFETTPPPSNSAIQ
jgi:hypothetical protein